MVIVWVLSPDLHCVLPQVWLVWSRKLHQINTKTRSTNWKSLRRTQTLSQNYSGKLLIIRKDRGRGENKEKERIWRKLQIVFFFLSFQQPMFFFFLFCTSTSPSPLPLSRHFHFRYTPSKSHSLFQTIWIGFYLF